MVHPASAWFFADRTCCCRGWRRRPRSSTRDGNALQEQTDGSRSRAHGLQRKVCTSVESGARRAGDCGAARSAWPQLLGRQPGRPVQLAQRRQKRRDGSCTVADCQGSAGPPGTACWDLNGDGQCNLPSEHQNHEGACTVAGCQGARGPSNCVSCWDLNGDGQCNVPEDSLSTHNGPTRTLGTADGSRRMDC